MAGYIVTSDVDTYFVSKNTGEPLANGILTFYRDSQRTVLKDVFQLSGAPPTYSYTSMGSQITLSAVGTVQNAGGDNEVIYYYPYDSSGNLDLYYIVCTDSYGNIQFTREAWPNINSSSANSSQGSDSSYLVGWDFSTNPYQLGTSGTITATPAYIADQTIAATVGGATLINWQTLQATDGLSVTSSAGSQAFYIMQYLDGTTVSDMIGKSLSVNVFGFQYASSETVTMRVYLYGGLSSAAFPTLSTTIGTLNTDGTFSLTAVGWNLIPNTNLPIPQVNLNVIVDDTQMSSDLNNYGFSGWEITNLFQIENTDKFAIVVTFTSTVSTVGINSISVVPGDIPARPAVQTPSDVLRQCQYYYEKSFPEFPFVARSNILDGFTSYGNVVLTSGNLNPDLFTAGFSVNFKVDKRKIGSIMTFYSPLNATSGNIGWVLYYLNSSVQFSPTGTTPITDWNVQPAFIGGVSVAPILKGIGGTYANNSVGSHGLMAYHYIADCRIGIV